jgi:hypothetical protein
VCVCVRQRERKRRAGEWGRGGKENKPPVVRVCVCVCVFLCGRGVLKRFLTKNAPLFVQKMGSLRHINCPKQYRSSQTTTQTTTHIQTMSTAVSLVYFLWESGDNGRVGRIVGEVADVEYRIRFLSNELGSAHQPLQTPSELSNNLHTSKTCPLPSF